MSDNNHLELLQLITKCRHQAHESQDAAVCGAFDKLNQILTRLAYASDEHRQRIDDLNYEGLKIYQFSGGGPGFQLTFICATSEAQAWELLVRDSCYDTIDEAKTYQDLIEWKPCRPGKLFEVFE